MAGAHAPFARRRFASKDTARRAVWDALRETRAARFPFPPHGRIPNFAGAAEAAERLLAHPLFEKARHIKVNPDAPQRPVRAGALRRGVTVYVPTPRLRGGFKRLDPARIPEHELDKAASLSKGGRWAEPVALEELPAVDLVVTGSVVVTRDGRRCGKGHGYGDLEYAILRELGHPPAPVLTSVHPLQIAGAFPSDPHDLPVSVIATPGELIEVEHTPAAPEGLDWSRLTPESLREMPVLEDVRRLVSARRGGAARA